MKSFKKGKNRKGMTLVEVIVAMAVFGVASLMIVMTLIYAIKTNSANYKRSNDVNKEGVYAETYDITKPYTAENINVQKNNISSSGSNKVNLSIDFGGSNVFNINDVYSYKAKLPGTSHNVQYQMQFFQRMDNLNSLADPDKGYFFAILYNDSSTEISGSWEYAVPNSADTFLFDGNGKKYANKNTNCGIISHSGGKSQVGFKKGADSTYLTIGGAGGSGFTLNASNFDQYAEKDSTGNYTGLVFIHFDGSSFLNQAQFEATLTGDEEEDVPTSSEDS